LGGDVYGGTGWGPDPPQQASYAQLRDAWLRVEEMEADTLFNWDHFFPLYGD
jgi:hypothetical protein